MESLDNAVKSVNSVLLENEIINPLLENNYFTYSVAGLLIIYSVIFVSSTPGVIVNMFKSSIGKLIILFLITLIASKNVTLALAMSIAFILFLQNKNSEQFMDAVEDDSDDDDESDKKPTTTPENKPASVVENFEEDGGSEDEESYENYMRYDTFMGNTDNVNEEFDKHANEEFDVHEEFNKHANEEFDVNEEFNKHTNEEFNADYPVSLHKNMLENENDELEMTNEENNNKKVEKFNSDYPSDFNKPLAYADEDFDTVNTEQFKNYQSQNVVPAHNLNGDSNKMYSPY